MRDDDELLSTPGLEFGSGVIGVCDICHRRQAVIILQKERYQLCVFDFLNKTFINSKEKPGRPLPPYRSERVWFPSDAVPGGKAPGVVLSPTKVVKHPVVLIAPDVYGLTTTLLDAAIRFAREGFEVMLPDVGKTDGIGPRDHLSLRSSTMFGGGVAVDSTRVRRMVALYRDALRYLRTREMVDPTKTAVFGSSYGASLATAIAGEDREVAALALAYPMPVKPADFLKLLTAPVLFVAGESDAKVATARRQFEEAQRSKEITVEFVTFPRVRSGFLGRDLPAYDLASAEAAWDAIVAFLRGRLLPPPPKAPTPPKPPVATPAAPPAAAPTAPATAPPAAPPASPAPA